jgi:O-antigen/teichoic acid export membrane protein
MYRDKAQSKRERTSNRRMSQVLTGNSESTMTKEVTRPQPGEPRGKVRSLRARQATLSIIDQVQSVGGVFLVNVALARTVSKPEYGLFTLAYSVFTFLSGLHNAALLEVYTVYGAGRYRERHSAYLWLIWRSNAILGLLLTMALPLIWLIFRWISPGFGSRPLLGVGLTSAIMLTAALVRRSFYVEKRPGAAAMFSFCFLVAVIAALWLSIRGGFLNGLSAFLIVAIAWTVAGIVLMRYLPQRTNLFSFREAAPHYWKEHWRYSRWVLATAAIFQLTTQGYYWIVAAFLSLKEVAELRAMYMLISPVDQLFTAINLLVLPLLASAYASGKLANFRSAWKRYMGTFLLISVSYGGLCLLGGRGLVHAIYNGKFDAVAPLFSAMCLLPVIVGLGNSMNAALKALERPNSVFWAYAASATATILIGMPLVIHFGLRGAVFGLWTSGTAYTIVLWMQFRSFAGGESVAGVTRPAQLPRERVSTEVHCE